MKADVQGFMCACGTFVKRPKGISDRDWRRRVGVFRECDDCWQLQASW